MTFHIPQKKSLPTSRPNYVLLVRYAIAKDANYNLTKNNSIIVLNQDKEKERERGAAIMNCKKYLDKFYTILNQFTKLDQDLT